MQYFIITYGCQMNISDEERISTLLEENGYFPALKKELADLVIVNACSVRQTAIDRVFGQAEKLKKLKRTNKNLKTVLTGCILEKDKKKFKERFDYIFNIKDLPKWIEILNKNSKTEELNNCEYLNIIPKHKSKFIAHVPIMTGCNNFCSYCAVPYTRGREKSRSVEDILNEIKELVKKGYKEIWLLGQNVNSYSPVPFFKLLKKVNDIQGDFWIRFTSSHPKDFSDDLIEAISECEKVTPYLNLPAQSGDNKILKKMNRPYTIEKYKEIIKKVKEKNPNITLSTDIIVGFPGETKEQFQNTANLLEEIKYDMVYISQYSKRPNTKAEELEDNIKKEEKKKREVILTEIFKKTSFENNQKELGRTTRVLIEGSKKDFLFGKTENYKSIRIKNNSKDLIGKFVKVKITEAKEWSLKGEVTSNA